MTKFINQIIPVSMFLFILAFVSGCVDQDFDTPPANGEDPNIPAESIMSILELKSMHTLGEIEQISSDKYISAVVVADDRSGNFYQQIIIEDETAGIPLLIDANNLFNQFPVGRRIFVKLQDLYLSDYNGLIQLAGQKISEDRTDGIPETLIDTYIQRGQYGLTVEPTTVTFGELTTERLGSLIKIENVQFASSDVRQNYAVADPPSSVNRTLELCDGGDIIVRTSGYSDLAAALTPDGSGSITAVYTTFGSTKQLILRDTSDVQFTADRCDGSGGPGGSVDGELMTLIDLRAEFTGTETNAPEGKKISGTVISDRTNENTDVRNMVVQSGSTGITVRFEDPHSYNMGDVVEIGTTDAVLSEFNGLLQMSGVALGNSAKTGTASVSPVTVTISEFLANGRDYESELIKIENVEMSKSGGTDYAFSVTLSDGTGTVPMFTRSGATFADDNFPTDTVSITAIGGIYNDLQVYIRNTDDVVVTGGSGSGGSGGTGGGAVVEEVNEDFQTNASNGDDVAITGWNNVLVKGERLWRGKTYQGNTYIQATAYQDMASEMETWLITPGIENIGSKTLSFESAMAYYEHNGLTVMISTDYDGSNFATATWTDLNPTLATSDNSNFEFVPSGNIDLSAYSGVGYIAFRYIGSGPSGNTTTWIVDNVVVD